MRYLLHSSRKMKSKLFIAVGAFMIAFALTLTLRSQSGEPVLRVGHGVTAPRPVNRPDPEYSEEARQAGLEGTCILSVVVNSEGKPEHINVSRSLGKGLDEKSIEAVRNWTFEPARKVGKPVAVQINVVVTFRLGKHAMTPDVRKRLERLQKEQAEFQRNAWKRVSRVEDVTGRPPLCHLTTQADDDPAVPTISELKSDVQGYRLTSITFTKNKTLTNATALRSLFPIQDGEPFDPRKVAAGLRNLRAAYHVQGFVSFKSSVEPRVDGSQRSIALQIECDEGQQFFVDHINIQGLDERTFERVRKSLYVKPGDLYNERLASFWLEKNSRLIAPDKSLRERIKLDVNENLGTLVMTYDFTRCVN